MQSVLGVVGESRVCVALSYHLVVGRRGEKV